MQQHCSVGRMVCAELPLDSLVWFRCQEPNRAQLGRLPRARAVCSAAAFFRVALRCVCAIVVCGCSNAARLGAWCVRSCRWIRRCGFNVGGGESTTTGTTAACTSCLLCRGLLSCGPVVLVHNRDAWCSSAARRAACCVHSCHWSHRCDGAGNCRIKRAIDARASCLLCRGLFSCSPTVHMLDRHA